MALRRWTPFLGAFQHIDAAIEASTDGHGGVSRDEFRKARGRIVELLCDAAASNDQAADGLGLLLDEAMAGSLATLRAVPAGRIRALLAAPGELVGAVGALMKEHTSERVRGLARDVVREWKLSVGAELARARTAMEVLDGISDDARPKKEEAKQPPKKTTIVSRSHISNAEPPPSTSVEIPVAVPAQAPKKPQPPRAAAEEQQKMAATKRKLQERYQEAEDAKRQRKVQMIKRPRPQPETTCQRRQNSVYPAMRARGPAASGTAERRFIKPLSRPIRV